MRKRLRFHELLDNINNNKILTNDSIIQILEKIFKANKDRRNYDDKKQAGKKLIFILKVNRPNNNNNNNNNSSQSISNKKH